MASRMIGIQISTTGLRLSQVRSGKVTATASARIPQGLVVEGRVTEPAAMASLIRDTMAARGIRGNACALVLPPQIVTAQHLSLPTMSRAELQLNLPFEFRDILAGELSDYDFDYIPYTLDEDGMELYAAAALRSTVEDYQRILKMAGLTLTSAIPAELAWTELLREKHELPRKLCILELGQTAHRLCIYSDGQFVTAKELPSGEQGFDGSTVAAIRRTIDLYDFSLPMGEAPLRDLILCGDVPDPVAEIPGLIVHPVSRLLDGITSQHALSAAVALQKEDTTTRTDRSVISPDKRTMHLVRVQKDFDHRKMLPLVALLAVALLVFAYFGFLVPLDEKAQAYNALSHRQEQLAQANERLLEFDQLEQDYLRYSDRLMKETEVGLVNRTEILTMVSSAVAPNAAIQDITVNNNVLTMNLSGITLEDAGILVTELERWSNVQQAVILSATAVDGKQAHILISVTLANTSEEGGGQNG